MNEGSTNKDRRPSVILLAALSGLTALSIDMNLPAMPQMQQVFAADVSAVQLTLSLFLVGFAVGQLVCGPLSDRWGRRPVLLIGLIVFTLAGLTCALSVSLPMIVICRFMQGLGASVGPIIARAVVRDRFDSRESSSVLSRITQVMVLAPLIAPTIGGYLLVFWGWAAIFITLGVCGLLVMLFSYVKLPETLPKTLTSEETASVWSNFGTVLSHRSSLRHTLTSAFSYAGMFAYISGSPFVLIDVFNVAEENFGYFFALTAVAVMLGASLNRFLVKRVLPAKLLRGGVYILLAAGIAIVSLAFFNTGGLAGIIVPMMVYMFGLGLVQPNATSAAMAPHGRLAGVSSSLIGCLQTAGGALTGFCVGAFYNHTPLSLAVMVAVMATLTFLVYDGKNVNQQTEGQPEVDIVPEIPVAVASK